MMRMQGAKRAIVVGALVVGLGFGGYAIAHNISQGNQVAAPGYVSPNSVKIVKKDSGGGIATFVEYNGKDIPLMAGDTGVRLGDSNYIISELTQNERQNVFSDVWYKQTPDDKKKTIAEAVADYTTTSIEALLTQEQKTGVLNSQWNAATIDAKENMITGVWAKLDTKYRYGVVKQEIDQLLDSAAR